MRGFRTKSYETCLKEPGKFTWEERPSEGYEGYVRIFGLKGCHVNKGLDLFFELQEEQPGPVSSNHREKDSRLI